jgi:E3 ubiquitin-protein ligase synoviolin
VIAPPRTTGAAGAAHNNVPGQQNANPADQPGAGGLPAPRIYQFGPFRIGFGAVRGGNLLNDLHRQLPQGNAPQPAANPQANVPAGQIGFGFGFGRRPQAPTPTPPQAPGTATTTGVSTASDLSTQLLLIEQRLTQELNTLRFATNQLNQVRQLQAELDRLRQQASPIANPGPFPNIPSPAPGTGASVFTARHQFGGSPSSSIMASGDSRLPEGLTLPPGWTLLPLQRMENGAGVTRTVQPPQPAPITTETHLPTPAASNTAVQIPVVSAPQSPANGDENGIKAQPTSEPLSSGANTVSNPQPTPTVPIPEHRPDSPSQEWTDLAPREAIEVGSTIPTSWGSGESSQQAPPSTDERTESPSKGKGRAVTVEETADEEL